MEDKKPLHTIKYGALRATIWENDRAARLFHDVTFSRCYREANGWASTYVFGTKDLPVLAKIILDAHSWIQVHLTGQKKPDSASTDRTNTEGDDTNVQT